MRCKVSIFHCNLFNFHMPLKRFGEPTPIFSDIPAGPANCKTLKLTKIKEMCKPSILESESLEQYKQLAVQEGVSVGL